MLVTNDHILKSKVDSSYFDSKLNLKYLALDLLFVVPVPVEVYSLELLIFA